MVNLVWIWGVVKNSGVDGLKLKIKTSLINVK